MRPYKIKGTDDLEEKVLTTIYGAGWKELTPKSDKALMFDIIDLVETLRSENRALRSQVTLEA
jgi:hypothetical protein